MLVLATVITAHAQTADALPTRSAEKAPAQSLDLATVVGMAVGNNTVLAAAQIRLHKITELIAQVNAQNKPQMRLDVAGYQTSYNTATPSLPTLNVQNPYVPGGGTIPDATDVAGGFSTAFIGSPNVSGSGGALALTPAAIARPQGSGERVSASASSTPAPNASSVDTHKNAAAEILPIMLAPLLAHTSSAEAQSDQPASIPAITRSPALANDEAAVPDAVSKAATGSSSSSSSTDQRDNYAARVSVIQYLDVFGLIPAARDAASNVRDFYALDLTRLQNEIALAAKNLYFNALFSQEELATQQEQVNFALENVRITKSRFNYGKVSQLDVLTAETSLASAQQKLSAAQNQRYLALAALDFLLGYPLRTQLDLVTPALPPLDASVDVEQTIQSALRDRPEIGQAKVSIAQAQRLVKLARTPLLPAVGIIASAEQGSVATSTLAAQSASIGALIEYSFDDGGLTRSRVRSAKLDVQAHDLALDQLKLTIGLEVQQTAYNISNAQAQVSSALAALTQAHEAVRIANERYTDGLGTFLDVLNALALLAQARTNLSLSNYLYQTSLAQLVRVMGGK